MPEENARFLEKSLSLAKNEGIYYGGARVKLKERSAVLFVGLGGSGADMLIRIKDQMKSRMILPADPSGAPLSDTPENIGFLEIDADTCVKELSYGSTRFNSHRNEFCSISTAINTPDVINRIEKEKERDAECWQWLDDDAIPADGCGVYGAGSRRQIGRLLLTLNIEKVVEAVERKIREITYSSAAEQLLVVVLGGISGGTGGGIILDMAYILKHIAKRYCARVTTMGYLIMPDVNESLVGNLEVLCRVLRRNGFACLKELDYWMSSEERGEPYCRKFPNGFELHESGRPFDFCHLINASDGQGHSFTYDKILCSIAESVFAYLSDEVIEYASETETIIARPYDCIIGYKAATAEYVSLGVSKLEIPCKEIAALMAARVFERLRQGMFRNRPTEEQFNRDINTRLELTEENIRSALYEQVTSKPALDMGIYRYADIWPLNVPYRAAYNWLAQFQRAVVQEAGNLSAKLEDKFKSYIKSNLRDPKTGPFYLCYFVKSNQNYCLDRMLEMSQIYYSELQARCACNSRTLTDGMQRAFEEGNNLRFGKSKNVVAKKYLDVVEAWCANEERCFLYEKMAEVIATVQARLKKYYDGILLPLKDMLEELPNIFVQNVRYIKERERMAEEGTDILIQPLEFENTKKKEFDNAVIRAESQFLNSLSANIKRWIGRDIDEADEDISTGADIAGFISDFISDNFRSLLTIDMETIMSTKLNKGETLEDYIKDRVDDLIAKSYPMFNKSGLSDKDPRQEFAIIFVPDNCETIYRVTSDYIAIKGLDSRIDVKRSYEKSRMYMVRAAGGHSLYDNAVVQEMKKIYEDGT